MDHGSPNSSRSSSDHWNGCHKTRLWRRDMAALELSIFIFWHPEVSIKKKRKVFCDVYLWNRFQTHNFVLHGPIQYEWIIVSLRRNDHLLFTSESKAWKCAFNGHIRWHRTHNGSIVPPLDANQAHFHRFSLVPPWYFSLWAKCEWTTEVSKREMTTTKVWDVCAR